MNALSISALAVLALYLGYRFYGGWIERRIVEPNDDNPTPAFSCSDGVDFCPAEKPLLFGHHFSSIAGAGPIIGPLVAVAYFGWLATILWIVMGSIFLGAVHDYLALMISVRRRGASIAEIARRTMGRGAKAVFSIFLWLALVLIITVFGVVGAQTLVQKPEIVFPTLMIIPIAMLFGAMTYRLRFPVVLGSFLAVMALFVCIWLGYHWPIALLGPVLGLEPTMFWFAILMIYCLVASVLPVWFLLQPRDYLSTYTLFIGLVLGYLGLIWARPAISAPAFSGLTSDQGPLWPMLFVIVACGAISGFHSLVASGTSSKQLAKESQGKIIGYGSMITEAVLAVLALMVVAAGLFWKAPPGLEEFGFQANFAKGWIVAFGTGYGRVVGQLPVISVTVAILFGMIMLKTFVLTTLDTATRLGRFIVTESLGTSVPIFRRRLIAAMVTILPAFYLGWTNSWKTIWPVFGAANQLIAALALVVISAYLVGVAKPNKLTVLPAAFMSATTVAALIWLAFNSTSGFFFTGKTTLGATAVVLVALAGYMVVEGVRAFRGLKKK
ncbi:MAG: carbon starvation protein CstA [candidate division Zixibacteria bacterium SM23_81]|nr:MAG: carbon starvation protein CstA [candidate division Zixibacteria bacterium SM23_81]